MSIFLLQADHDTYIIMENLKHLLSHYNASKPLFAGAIYVCRCYITEKFCFLECFSRFFVADCQDFDGDEPTDEVCVNTL